LRFGPSLSSRGETLLPYPRRTHHEPSSHAKSRFPFLSGHSVTQSLTPPSSSSLELVASCSWYSTTGCDTLYLHGIWKRLLASKPSTRGHPREHVDYYRIKASTLVIGCKLSHSRICISASRIHCGFHSGQRIEEHHTRTFLSQWCDCAYIVFDVPNGQLFGGRGCIASMLFQIT
jgi:hypothetical protein